MIRVKRPRQLTDLFIPLVILLPLCLALLPGGLANTADGPVHFIRSAEMVHGWQDGLWVPRWSANLGNGYGLPLFVYAPPLPYFLTAFFHLLGLPLELAFKGTWLFCAFSAAFGAYHLNRSLLGRFPGAVGAAAYVYAPIVLREFFIQGNVAQLLGWTFAPWACWGIIQLWRKQQWGYGLVLACAVMGAMLSHNAVALLLAGTIGGMSVVLLLFTRQWRAFLFTLGGSLLGLALSAWFWFPALREGEYVQLSRIVASDFRPRFIPLAELIALSPRLDTGAINPYFPLTLGAVQVWLALLGALLLGLVILRRHQGERLDTLTIACTCFFLPFTFFCGLMATKWSEPIWNVLPFVNLFEWPFRWHGFTMLGLSWLCAFAIFAVELYQPRLGHWVGALALLLLIGSALVNLYPDQLPLGTFKSGPADVVRFEVNTQQIGTTSLGEFDPIWTDSLAKLPPLEDYRKQRPVNRLPRRLPAGVQGTQTITHVQRHQFQLKVDQPVTLTLALLYFPGWQATLDGAPLSIRPHPHSGLIDLTLDAGAHTLLLTFGETPLRWWSDFVSLIAWLGLGLGLIGWLVRQKFQRKGAKAQRDQRQETGDVAASGWPVFLTVAICTGLLTLTHQFSPEWFRVHSPPDQALPATTKLQVDFGDQLRLLGVDSLPIVATAGDAVTVVTYWRAQQRLANNYGLFLHLDAPNGETIATVDQTHPNNIPTASWAPGLYVRAPLRFTIPPTASPIRYRLRVGIVEPRSHAWLSPNTGADDVFEIGQLWVEPVTPVRAIAGPQARFGEAIRLIGAHYDRTTQTVTLHWQTDQPLTQDYAIFIHALDAKGTILDQVDGTPYQNQYPTSAWRPKQVIEDQRRLSKLGAHAEQLTRLAIGVYDPATGIRLPISASDSQTVADNALIMDVSR
ncbi:MAG: 6-pyruvoyl-tetrahydropterin synthase-related protein [Caldilineaceae bacterium]